jgi:hypothetical protein
MDGAGGAQVTRRKTCESPSDPLSGPGSRPLPSTVKDRRGARRRIEPASRRISWNALRRTGTRSRAGVKATASLGRSRAPCTHPTASRADPTGASLVQTLCLPSRYTVALAAHAACGDHYDPLKALHTPLRDRCWRLRRRKAPPERRRSAMPLAPRCCSRCPDAPYIARELPCGLGVAAQTRERR